MGLIPSVGFLKGEMEQVLRGIALPNPPCKPGAVCDRHGLQESGHASF